MAERTVSRTVCALVLLFLASGCSHPIRVSAVPDEATTRATIPGIPNARFWVDTDPHAMVLEAADGRVREAEALTAAGYSGPMPPAHFLAISGGGDDGAFGAGLLVGWTETGERPEFKLVTGVSTGALTAPFAFLGPDYDDELRDVYTSISPADVLARRPIYAAVADDGMADSMPLRTLISRYANEEMLERIAAEYARGRFLLIGTTNLDARRAIIWNIGAIASSGSPNAVELFRSILVASAAVPGAFPPVMIDVEVDGTPYQEMHVDGGAVSQVFVYPASISIEELESEANRRERTLYIIRNARLDPEWATVERRTIDIAARAISSLIHSQGLGDLQRIYLASRRDGIDYNLAYIGSDFNVPHTEQFDSHYMQELFAYGYELGRAGFTWEKFPPGYRPSRAEQQAVEVLENQ